MLAHFISHHNPKILKIPLMSGFFPIISLTFLETKKPLLNLLLFRNDFFYLILTSQCDRYFMLLINSVILIGDTLQRYFNLCTGFIILHLILQLLL